MLLLIVEFCVYMVFEIIVNMFLVKLKLMSVFVMSLGFVLNIFL